MKFGSGAVRLQDIVNGRLFAGIVPWPRMAREKVSAKNAGIVTVLAANTAILTLALQDVLSNDLLLVSARVSGTKGITLGNTDIFVNFSAGTASFFAYNDKLLLDTRLNNQPASSVCIQTLVGMLSIFGGGTLTLALTGASAGSNLTVSAGDGQLEVLVLRF